MHIVYFLFYEKYITIKHMYIPTLKKYSDYINKTYTKMHSGIKQNF